MAIAAGEIGGAAARVEGVLESLLSLAINFLAGFAGLGKVADRVLAVIKKVWSFIDKALDRLVEWIVGTAKRLFQKIFGGKGQNQAGTVDPDRNKAIQATIAAVQPLLKQGATDASISGELRRLESKYEWKSLALKRDGETFDIEGTFNPTFSLISAHNNFVVIDIKNTTPADASSGWQDFEIEAKGILVKEVLPAIFSGVRVAQAAARRPLSARQAATAQAGLPPGERPCSTSRSSAEVPAPPGRTCSC